MNQPLTFACSPCPNDTFAFYALAHEKISTELKFHVELADVESLNQAAKEKRYPVTKLSFAGLGHLLSDYGLLRTGAALGRGCGPLVVARPGARLFDLAHSPIAVPGLWTTACMLLGLYLKKPPQASPMPFDRIMPALAKGEFDFGVIIHEGRFTYHQYDLIRLVDLGEWWERQTGLPIPLGGIAVRRDLGRETAKQVEAAISQSVAYAFDHPTETREYVRAHAQELADSVIHQHIQLYVNAFTRDLGAEGAKAVEMLFLMGHQAGLLPPIEPPVFAA